MIFFILGVATVFAALMEVVYWLMPVWPFEPGHQAPALIVRGIIAPTLAAWVVAEMVHVMTPRRNFDRRLQLRIRPFLSGVIAGIIGAVIGSFALALVEGETFEFLVLAGAGALGAVVPLVSMRRVRAGHCIRCDYDLRGQPGPGTPGNGVCPECGTPSRTARPGHANPHLEPNSLAA